MKIRTLGTQGLSVSFLLPGTKRVAYIEENAKASEISFITEDLNQLSEIAPVGRTELAIAILKNE